jgi:hypothetical protein
LVVLTIVLPIADLADLESTAFVERPELATGTCEPLSRDRRPNDGCLVEPTAVAVEPL